jgi:hypothetical protein
MTELGSKCIYSLRRGLSFAGMVTMCGYGVESLPTSKTKGKGLTATDPSFRSRPTEVVRAEANL